MDMSELSFDCHRADLAAGVNQVKSLVRDGDALNPFRNIRISSRGNGQIAISASNDDLMAETLVDAKVTVEGVVCVPGTKFAAFVNAMPAGRVSFVVAGGRATLRNGESSFGVVVADPQSFCEMHRPSVDAVSMSMGATVLAEMLRKVEYAASRDKTRYVLSGVNFATKKTDDGYVLMLTATDGRRLSNVSSAVCGDMEASFTLGNDAVKELHARLNGDSDGMVTVESDGKTSFSRGERWSLWTKLVELPYPSWGRVVPTDVPNVAMIDRATFAEEVKRVSLAADRDGAFSGIHLTFKDGACVLEAGSEMATSRSAMVVKYSGADVKLSVDPKLVLDVLGAIDEHEIKFMFKDGSSSFMIQCLVPFIGVIMPLREAE